MSLRVPVLLILGIGMVLLSHAQSSDVTGCDALKETTNCRLVDDFESDTPGTPPGKWRANQDRKLVPYEEGVNMNERKNVYVRSENGNQFARIYTAARGLRVLMARRSGLDWNLDKRPILRWTWRAKKLPEGGNAKKSETNDTGGALYVTFGTDWLGRPKSIKYTYSSTLPVGTTVDYGPLKVLVVTSKAEQGIDRWVRHERNVIDDYKRLFGDPPDKTPAAIAMWGDSDTLNDTSTIDFDDLLLLSAPSSSR